MQRLITSVRYYDCRSLLVERGEGKEGKGDVVVAVVVARRCRPLISRGLACDCGD